MIVIRSLATIIACSSAAALLLFSSTLVHATGDNDDCQPPNDRTYTGYSLKTGTNCQQYVYCQGGVVSSWNTCPNGLLYNGSRGAGGICTWPQQVNCDVADAVAAPPEPPRVTNPSWSQSQAQSQAQSPEPPRVTNPSSQSQSQSQAEQSPIMEAFSTSGGTSGNDNNPQHFFCGKSPADAASLCFPCPSGEIFECIGDFTHGCFKGIAACAGSGSGGGGGGSSNNIISSNSNGGSSNNGSSNNGGSNNYGSTYDNTVANILDSNKNNIVEEFLNVAALNNNYQNQPTPSYQTNNQQPSYQTNNQRPTYETNQGNNNNGYYQTNQYNQQSNNQATQTVPGPSRTSKPVPTPQPSLPPWTNAPFNPTPGSTTKTVIGYYASWQWYDRNKLADPQNIKFSKYDRINYAFFQPCPMGNLFGTDEWADPQLLWGPFIYDTNRQIMSGPNRNYFCSWDGPLKSDRNCNYHDTSRGLINLAHGMGVEVMPSIGGWTLSDNFPGIAANAAKRENFATQCVQLIEDYGFDGIDLDWEYPGYEDHSGTSDDTVNFTLLLRAIRRKLDQLGSVRNRFYGLTAALPCGPDKIAKIQVDQIKDILTELNLMSYDLHGAWDVLTGTNAPMYDQGWTDKTKRWSVHGCVNNYVDLGVPLSKMNIGLPFYGRSFRGATGMKQFHQGADDINFHLDEGSPQYFNILNELRDMTTYRHENTQTQYAVFNNGGGLVSYDDPRAICDKVGYANARGMHGFLIWEISGDMINAGNGVIRTPLADAMNTKIKNPNYHCANLKDPLWALAGQTYRHAPAEPASVDWTDYVGPRLSSGGANDYDGAQVPAPGPTVPAYTTPQNTAYAQVPPPVPKVPEYNSQQNMVFNSAPAGNNLGNSRPSGSTGCPQGHTGYAAAEGCTKYMYCSSGHMVGAMLPCVPGTLFDVEISGCVYASNLRNKC